MLLSNDGNFRTSEDVFLWTEGDVDQIDDKSYIMIKLLARREKIDDDK